MDAFLKRFKVSGIESPKPLPVKEVVQINGQCTGDGCGGSGDCIDGCSDGC